VRARGKSDSKTDRQTHRRIVQNHFSGRFGGCTSQIRSYLEVDFLHDANTSIDMEVKHPPPLISGKYYPDCAVQGRLSIPSEGKYFKRVLIEPS